MRASGILMHISSLPGPYGIGTLGKNARGFVDFLSDAGQTYWQLLPLTPTGYGDSPYQSLSTFAGNHYLIDLDLLIEQGLLREEEVTSVSWGVDPTRVDFGRLYENRTKVLYKAYERFIGMPNSAFKQFIQSQQNWLPDYALFMALKEAMNGKPWLEWDEDLRLRKPEALATWREKLKYQIVFQYFLQFTFFEQWNALRAYAKGKGISIIGDVPIYVPLDSADVWANPELFWLDQDRKPVKVAGCPPDAFTEDGQLWGNPIYDWKKMEDTGFAWWIRRLQAAGQLFDVVRLDHFRGYEAYWAVPYGDKTARNGQWIKGPGMAFVEAIHKELPELDFIAEDLGYLTQEVIDLQRFSGYPGMKVLQFAYDSREPSEYLPHTYEVNSVCYTGTHDNQPLGQWFSEITPQALAYAREYMALHEPEGDIWGAIRCGMSTVSKLFVAQMQDYLELGKESRMNFPGTLGGNWTWRAEGSTINKELAKKIAALTKLYGR